MEESAYKINNLISAYRKKNVLTSLDMPEDNRLVIK